MLITCKKRTNETLKNPENTLFCVFLHFFDTFSLNFLGCFIFSCTFAAKKKSKSAKGFIMNINL